MHIHCHQAALPRLLKASLVRNLFSAVWAGIVLMSPGGMAWADKAIQPVPFNAPTYFHFTYPAAMAAPLPLASILGRPLILTSSQAYTDPLGTLGVYQTSGTVLPIANPFFQSLGSNGRSCFSCHAPASGMSVSAAAIQLLYTTSAGQDPVFAPVDGANCPSNVPAGLTLPSLLGGLLGGSTKSARDAHSLLLDKGLFRIFLPVPANAEYRLEVVSDPYGCNTDPLYATQKDPVTQQVKQMVSVYRRPRMSANLNAVTTPALTLGGGGLPNIDFVTGASVVDPATGASISGNIMWDGREPTLESQARNATLGHAQALVAPTDAQVAQIVAYEKSVFAAQSFHSTAGNLTGGLGDGATGGPKPLSTTPVSFGPFTTYNAWPTGSLLYARQQASIARGQAIFNSRQLTVANVAGFNNAAILKVTNPTSTTCASCHGNMPAGNDPFPAGQRDIGVGGQGVALGGPAPATDLPIFRLTCTAAAVAAYNGKVVLTNDPGLALISGRCADIGRRSVPQLRALDARAPYFSDGSAATLGDVVSFYDKRFGIGLSATEKADLANFLAAL
jgi:cytochrome c peroxidase